jgi:hypothetical protein
MVGGGCINTSSGSFSIVGNGACNTASGTYSVVVGGFKNNANSNCSFIAGGQCNSSNSFANTFILGTNLSANQANFTYVNNLSVQGNIYGTLNAPAPTIYSNASLTYTLSLSDNTNTVLLSSPSTNYFIVSSNIIQPGFQAAVLQLGTGLTYISAAPGVTINSAGNRYKLYQQYSAATLLYINSTIGWTLFGDLSA